MSTHPSSPDKLSTWLIIVLILIATWIRLWRFPNIPPAFNYDEAYNVIDTLWLRESGTFVAFLPGNIWVLYVCQQSYNNYADGADDFEHVQIPGL